MNDMKSVLFLCTGNSCRSQMAEGFALHMAPEGVRVYSAGVNPVGVNPLAVQVMAEAGIDISCQDSKDLDAVPAHEVEILVTLCGDAAERCPTLPGVKEILHWPLRDPARATGSPDEALRSFREARDDIAARVRSLFAG
jgi:arsenate reductase